LARDGPTVPDSSGEPALLPGYEYLIACAAALRRSEFDGPFARSSNPFSRLPDCRIRIHAGIVIQNSRLVDEMGFAKGRGTRAAARRCLAAQQNGLSDADGSLVSRRAGPRSGGRFAVLGILGIAPTRLPHR